MKILLVILFASLTTFAQTTLTADRIGINEPNPSVPLEFKVRYPAETTASETLIQFKTPTGHDPFQIYQRSTMFGTDKTDSVGIGFGPAGDPQGAPNLQMIFEDQFGSAPSPVNYELHYQMCPTDTAPVCTRPMTWTFDRKTGKAIAAFSAETHFYGKGWLQTDGAELHIMPTAIGATGLFSHRGDVHFETVGNGGAPAQQIRIVASPLDAGTSQLQFGQGPNPALVNNGSNGLRLYRYGTSNAPFFAGSVTAYGDDGDTPKTVIDGTGVRVDGIKVVGAQCAAIADPPTSSKYSNSTLIAILACLRSHGLVAPQ